MANSLNIVQHWLANPTLVKLLESGVGILVITILFRILARVSSRRIRNADLRYRIRKMFNLSGYAMAGLLITVIFSDSLGRLTVIFGVVGAGVAFALQEVIVSFAGWVAISLGEFYNSGDRVQLGGIMGDVIDISPLRTTLMECGDWVGSDLYNGRIVRIANSFVFKEPVFNYSGDFPFVWDEIKVPVRHGSDYRLARKILEEAVLDIVESYIEPAEFEWKRMVHKYLIEDARIEPFVTLMATDNWLEFTVRYVVDYKKRRVVKDQLFTRILEKFDATNRQVAFASTTVELTAAPDLAIRLTRPGHSAQG
jgi:small-conductance mechanosensitive channel